MNRYNRRLTCVPHYRVGGIGTPSTVPSLPQDVYGDGRGIDESPFFVPIFDPEKAEKRAHGIAEAFRDYVALEGVAVGALCDGEELEAVLLDVEELLCSDLMEE